MSLLHKMFSAALLALWAMILPAHALTVSPMHIEMTSAGSRSHAQITVVNTGAAAIPVEASMMRLTLDEAGRQKIAKAGEDFLVMPPQAIIPPGATQNFRVQWLGEPMLAKSESFLLSVNQVPVKLPTNKPAVQVVMSVGVMINVAPPEGAPALRVVASGIATTKDGQRAPQITVENTSNVHALLPSATIELSAPGWSSTLSPQLLGNSSLGIGLVQPGKRRRFVLPVVVPPGVQKFETKVELPAPRR